MAHGFPRGFRAALVAVLLLLCITLASQLIVQHSLRTQITLLTEELSISRQRLAKQQLEYDHAVAKLPEVLAELERTRPLADAVYEQEQLMRQQRKTLRAENAALADELAALTPELDAASAAVLNAQLASSYLDEALEAVRAAEALLR